MEERRPTLEEVAALAGVSRGTASRALSGGKNVSPRALAAVTNAAGMLGYRPNLAARSLVLRRSGSIGLVVSEDWNSVFGQPYFAGVVRGASNEAEETGSQLLLAIVHNDDDRRRFARFAAGIHMDGALLVSFGVDDAFPEILEAAGVPVVSAGRSKHARYSVDADNRGGARHAVAHLLRSGRERIAIISGPPGLAVSHDRLAGWREALRARKLKPDPELIEPGDFNEPSGRAAVRALLQRKPDLDAIFATSDLMAFGALAELRAVGRRVPDDVALIGFDDAPGAALSDPALTTVAQPVDRTGHEMVRMLVQRLQGETVAEPHLVLPTELVERASA